MKEAIKDCVGYLKSEPLIAFILFLLWTNYNLNQRFQSCQECRVNDLIKSDSVKTALSRDRGDAWKQTTTILDKTIQFTEKYKKDTLK